MATSTGPWDETDDSTSYDPPATRPPRRSTLRVSHLRQPYARPPSPPRHPARAASSRPKMGGAVAEKVEDLAASLQATTEVLSTADRMLEHYRDINVEQDEEIAKVELAASAFNEFANLCAVLPIQCGPVFQSRHLLVYDKDIFLMQRLNLTSLH